MPAGTATRGLRYTGARAAPHQCGPRDEHGSHMNERPGDTAAETPADDLEPTEPSAVVDADPPSPDTLDADPLELAVPDGVAPGDVAVADAAIDADEAETADVEEQAE